jgi:ammonia channel protein AmtB
MSIRHGECIRKRVRQANSPGANEAEDGRQMGRGEMGLMCHDGLCVCVVWVRFGALVVTALAHALVCWRRSLHMSQISTIADGAFAGLVALTRLYGAVLWPGSVVFVACCSVLALMWVAGG